MKKIFTLFLLLISISSFAQPSLLWSEMAAPGTVFTYKHVGSFTPIDTSIQGANQTWNYSTVSTTADPDLVIEVINPALTVHASTFPTANWGTVEDGTDYSFFHGTTSMMERLGDWDLTHGYTNYTNTQIEYVFPMQLGVSNFDASTNVNMGNTSNSTYAFDCVGYGTIMVPGHTYTNAIMTRIVVDIQLFQIETFIWYDSDNGMPVFQYVVEIPGILPEAAIYLNSVTPAGIDENSFASNLYINNPVSSYLTMSLYSEKAVALSYELRNSLGAILQSGVLEKSQFQQLQLDMESNASGLYFFTVRDVANPLRSRSVKVVKD